MPFKVLHTNPEYSVQAVDPSSYEPAVILKLFRSESNDYNSHVLFNKHPNIVSLIAHGMYKAGTEWRYALAMELPRSTVRDELESIVQGRTDDSPLFEKFQIRKIVKDVVNGLHQLQGKSVQYSVTPETVFLFEEPDATQLTAKLTFSHNMPNNAGDNPDSLLWNIRDFGFSFLDSIIGALYYKAKQLASPNKPCPPPRDSKDSLLSDLCDIATNLYRISRHVKQHKGWTLEQVLKDAWLNGSA